MRKAAQKPESEAAQKQLILGPWVDAMEAGGMPKVVEYAIHIGVDLKAVEAGHVNLHDAVLAHYKIGRRRYDIDRAAAGLAALAASGRTHRRADGAAVISQMISASVTTAGQSISRSSGVEAYSIGRVLRLTWSRGGQPALRARLRPKLAASIWSSEPARHLHRHRIAWRWTDTAFGGRRRWLACPGCTRACRVVYHGAVPVRLPRVPRARLRLAARAGPICEPSAFCNAFGAGWADRRRSLEPFPAQARQNALVDVPGAAGALPAP